MKRIHLLFVAIITCTFALAFLSGNTYAVSAANEAAAPVSNTAKSKTATGAKQQIAHDVNINTADKKLLTQLPGIGPVTADAILKYRDTNGEFKSIDELTKIKGIGNKTLAKLKPYLVKI
ncbi:helix-hairpin-helix domain-containing protein [Desulfopila sp. IMCC35006]|uniref:ComEA family DNA-binding protein n=1 Tax=Desulfopila sp. IMCC35006 TaxID=2569542 RepID=UPI0010AB954C|nr:helix-hairpin-helix domain-containing protein [Desulfopila sp. IMCC35006]TKB26179.1 helix-hairpin-helix domain-containing protein [Desulfopila sp. IMCC35006]